MVICMFMKGLWVVYPWEKHSRGETLHLGRSCLELSEPAISSPSSSRFSSFQTIEWENALFKWNTPFENTASLHNLTSATVFNTPPTQPNRSLIRQWAGLRAITMRRRSP